MWDELPLDLLSRIFSFLPPDSLACSLSTCTHWRRTATITIPTTTSSCWLIAIPSRSFASHDHSHSSFTYTPSLNRWYSLPLHFLPSAGPIRLIAAVLPRLLLCKLSTSPPLSLLLFSPFTRHYQALPALSHPRTNPAIAVLPATTNPQSFTIYVAGGASGSSYEQSVEVYDSRTEQWSNAGCMPLEFAVRLTVWTPNESVYANGVIYWMTSARVYSVVGFDVEKGSWREVKVPLADRLEFAALVRRENGRVGVVGGCAGGNDAGWVWELGEGDVWVVVGLVGGRVEGSGGCVKCVGGGEVVYLYRELGSGRMLMGRVGGCVEWSWVGGCGFGVGKTPVKAVLMHT